MMPLLILYLARCSLTSLNSPYRNNEIQWLDLRSAKPSEKQAANRTKRKFTFQLQEQSYGKFPQGMKCINAQGMMILLTVQCL